MELPKRTGETVGVGAPLHLEQHLRTLQAAGASARAALCQGLRVRVLQHPFGPARLEEFPQSWTLVSEKWVN